MPFPGENRRTSLPVWTSHTMASSQPVETRNLLLGLKEAQSVCFWWVGSRRISLPVAGSHRMMGDSSDANDASSLPFGEKRTRWHHFLWPSSRRRRCPVEASHRQGERSSPPVASSLPSGE